MPKEESYNSALSFSSLSLRQQKKLMATSHARSISLPSRSHPTIPQIQELVSGLRRLSDITPLSLSEIFCKLSGLGDLFDVFDKFLSLPQSQQALTRGCNEKWADELLDGLVLLLDVCGTAKDVFSQAKQQTQELQSMLRRRRADESEVAKEVGEYLASRKKAKKIIHRVLKDLNTKCSRSHSDKGNNIVAMAREIQGVTLTTLQSLLFYVSGLKTQPKLSSWTLVSNLMRPKHVESNEFEKIDAALHIFLGYRTKKCIDLRIENVQAELGKLGLSLEDVEQELECLQRGFIKARVSLLNILNH